MPTIQNALRRPAAGTLAILTLASVGLSACGSSSGTSSHASAAASSGTTATSAARAATTSVAGAATTSTAGAATSTSPSSHPGARFGRPNGSGSGPAKSSVFRHALAKYAGCLRQNGVNMPAPSTSGKGPIYNTKGINTGSPQFRAATKKCRGTLIGAVRRAR
jgi:hypothetical protein